MRSHSRTMWIVRKGERREERGGGRREERTRYKLREKRRRGERGEGEAIRRS